jgi:hypothetical protein
MKIFLISTVLVALLSTGCNTMSTQTKVKRSTTSPASLNMKKAEEEVNTYYSKAHPEVQEFVLWTARGFGRSKRWLNEDAFSSLSPEEREKKVKYLIVLLNESEYGRHLLRRLAEASALKDKRLVPGLMKIAAYSRGRNYDCAPKWMAVAALARQQSDESVPLLISLVDHGNQNTRMWARAALARRSGHDFGKDKQAWAKWWEAQGNKPIDKKLLKPWKMPPKRKKRR